MRLKTFTAPTIHEVMKQIRDQLGENAVIVSTQSLKSGKAVRVTAAIDPNDPEIKATDRIEDIPPEEKLKQILDYHQISMSLKDELLADLSTRSQKDLVSSLTIALEKNLQFDRIGFEENECYILVGLPGSGKTMTAIKLATRAKMLQCPVRVVTTDFFRPCAVDEMKSFTKMLKLDLFTAQNAEELQNIKDKNAVQKPMIIDTTGINPFNARELKALEAFAKATSGKMILILPAGMDPAEALDVADAFKSIGCENIIGAKLDLTRRVGNLLEVAYESGYALTDFGVSRHPAEGLEIATPQFLAKAMLQNIM